MKLIATFATTTVLSIAAIGSVQADPTRCDPGEEVIKFSHIVNTDRHPKGIAAELLRERVNAEMDGIACMEVYGSSTLYNDDQVLEAMLQGDVQLAAPSLSKFEAFTKQFRIFDLPFLFANMEAVDEFQSSDVAQAMKSGMEHRGLVGLEFWHNGMKQITANAPVLVPEDMAGLKMRVQSADVIIAQMDALGASSQPMAFPEVYGALQTGVVDGQQNTYSNIYGQKFFEVQDGVTETNHLLLDYMVVTSVDWWDSMTPEFREQFSTILAEVTEARNGEAERVNQEAKQAILDAGGIVRELTAEQRQMWVDAMQPVWKQFEAEIGAENIQAAQEINTRVTSGN
ncbi:DctP family TRAP transporter solute-binding subunit [Thalassorhabdomicrobium marinisediminis]|uniref:C4-dicarboxylate ABC transporter n=1 Tax=Thalassorhabdomicrobium marinisediminis TaxID=2170577 RepID=A0A2T7FXB7_9RHOB|nr:DctP family TRAP transporter solute-binding subunit [Thalassorhabdomicrobium marinisediminis]PVA06807.1 C4-dicarboxylate ABC transporter [Thalassorhabdomicrobium marinisediminis]